MRVLLACEERIIMMVERIAMQQHHGTHGTSGNSPHQAESIQDAMQHAHEAFQSTAEPSFKNGAPAGLSVDTTSAIPEFHGMGMGDRSPTLRSPGSFRRRTHVGGGHGHGHKGHSHGDQSFKRRRTSVFGQGNRILGSRKKSSANFRVRIDSRGETTRKETALATENDVVESKYDAQEEENFTSLRQVVKGSKKVPKGFRIKRMTFIKDGKKKGKASAGDGDESD